MNINDCYVCKKPIPKIRIEEGKFSLYCDKCTAATKWKEDLFEVQSDWNEGIVYFEDGAKFYFNFSSMKNKRN